MPLILFPPTSLLTKWLASTWTRREARHKDDLNLLSQNDVIVVASLAQEPAIDSLLGALKGRGVPWGFVLDNWDNLTSKIIFTGDEEFITVMGKSSVRLGTKIHNLSASKFWPLGLPRLEPYRLRPELWTHFKPGQLKYNVLYVGYSVRHDEVHSINALRRLSNEMGVEVNIRYRPHPGGPRDVLNGSVELEDGIELSLSEDGERLRYGGLPPLDETYFDDIRWSDIVVGPPTTLVLEALLTGRPVILDLNDSGNLRTNPASTSQNYEHIQELLTIPGMISGRSSKDLVDGMMNLIRGDASPVAQSDVAELFDVTDTPFAEKLTLRLKKKFDKGRSAQLGDFS